jgi:hypothetical protein
LAIIIPTRAQRPKEEMPSIDREISEVTTIDTTRIFIGMAIAACITLIVVSVLSYTHSFEARKSYESPDVSKTNNSIMINLPHPGSYSVSKLVAGMPVHFLLDLHEMPSSAIAIRVTITGDTGQSILFFPKSYGQNKIQFQYEFPSPGTFNVDITSGAPEGVNMNINVARGDSVT